MAGGLFLIVPAAQIWVLLAFAIIFGLAYGGCISVESPMVAQLFGLKSMGIIMGFISFAFTMGGALGPWLTGFLFDIQSTYKMAFLISGGLSSLGFLLTLVLNVNKTDSSTSP